MALKLKRIKAFKARPPEETIQKIKAILNGSGLHLIEKPVKGISFFKASRLSIINPENQQIIFSTCGKGTSAEWASASAWGEMIERIQNLAFYMIFIYPSRPESRNIDNDEFNYFPDEKIFKMTPGVESEFLKNCGIIMGTDIYKIIDNEHVIGVPFYDLFEEKTVYFPFRAMQVIVGSNGMCSGNNLEEALIQGICEVFERHILKMFYLAPFCPPDIPLRYFRDTEIGKIINQLSHEQGYIIRIKDCSLNKRYPVIGVLIRNNQNDYAFHLGADPCPITALERCFTEMYQDGSICFKSMEELNNNLPCNLDTLFWKRNLSLTIKSYAGHWPPSIMQDRPAYAFNGFDHPESVSDHEDLKYLLNILKNEKRKIYLRDNSFLGQSAFYIYIPGMSEITSFPDNSFSNAVLELDKYLPSLTNLKKSTRHSRIKIMEILQKFIHIHPYAQSIIADYFRFNQKHPVAHLSSEQLQTLIAFSLLKGELTDHFSIQEIEHDSFLNSISLEKGNCKPSEIFHKLNIPDCFDCNACLYKTTCNLQYIALFWERIKKQMKLYNFEQISSLDPGNG